MHLVEGLIGLFTLSSLVVGGFALTDGTRQSFSLTKAADEFLRETGVRPLSYSTDQFGNAQVTINSDVLHTLTRSIRDAADAKLSKINPQYMIEVSAFSAPIDPVTGVWTGGLTRVSSDRIGPYNPSAEILAATDLETKVRALLLKTITINPDPNHGGVAYQASQFANLSALRGQRDAGSANFLPITAILAVRLAIDLGDGITGKLWETTTGEAASYTSKVVLLRGEY